MSTPVQREVRHPAIRWWCKLLDYLTYDFLGGPKVMKMCWTINLQKGGTIAFVLALMYKYDCWTPTAYTYLAIHGSYGLSWLLKEMIFPDPKWAAKTTIGSASVAMAAVLGPYWYMPYMVTHDRIEQSPAVLTTATMVYALGLVMMVGADAQKYFVLKQKRGLITDGFFSRIRHPNYTGEMMIYGSFAALTGRWEAAGILAWVWGGLFYNNIMNKEVSMSRYAEWADYKKRTGYLLPKLFIRRK